MLLDFFRDCQAGTEGYLFKVPLSENPTGFFPTVSGNDVQMKMRNCLSSRYPVILKYIEPAGLIRLDQRLNEFLSVLENGEQLTRVEVKDRRCMSIGGDQHRALAVLARIDE